MNVRYDNDLFWLIYIAVNVPYDKYLTYSGVEARNTFAS